MNAVFITQFGHGIRKVIRKMRTALSCQLHYLGGAAATRTYGRNIRAHGAATDNNDLGFSWGKQHLIFLSTMVRNALLLAP